jgi:hypothetical protein
MSYFNNYYTRHITTLIVILGLGFLYNRYKEKFEPYDQSKEYNMIKRYLLNVSDEADKTSLGENKTMKGPLLWVHMDYTINSRNWLDFYSRNSSEFNQPYQYLTISSIVNHCGKSFNIVLIDDNTFNHIIPGWKQDLSTIPDPIKSNMRKLGLCKILYLYGGLLLPSSFLCMKDLYDFYRGYLTKGKDMFVGTFINNNVTSQYGITDFMPDIRLIGCKRNSNAIGLLINYIQKILSTDYTSEEEFDGKISRKCFEMIENKKIEGVCPGMLGVKDNDNKPILLDDLMGEKYIKIKDCAVGIYIPADQILKRTKYEWFSRLNVEQVLESNMAISKYLLVNTFNENNK